MGRTCDSASTWQLRFGHPITDIALMEALKEKHDLVVVHSIGMTYHVYGKRADLEAATEKWNERLKK